MSDLTEALKSLNLRALREMARKQLGAGYSRLKTKSQLVIALGRRLDPAAVKALLARVAPAKGEGGARGKGGGKPPAAEVRKLEAAPPRPRRKGDSARARQAAAAPDPAGRPAAPRPGTSTVPTPAAPVAEPPARPVYDERLGELPDRYGDDALVALPVDPVTLFVYWDFAGATVERAAQGLVSPRAVLSVHAGPEVVREVDFALESRSFYLHGLAPARAYHAEIDFVGADGRRRRVGRPSSVVFLPPDAPSPIVLDRFVAFEWERPRELEPRAAPGAAQRDLGGSAWRGGSSLPGVPAGADRPWIAGGQGSGRGGRDAGGLRSGSGR